MTITHSLLHHCLQTNKWPVCMLEKHQQAEIQQYPNERSSMSQSFHIADKPKTKVKQVIASNLIFSLKQIHKEMMAPMLPSLGESMTNQDYHLQSYHFKQILTFNIKIIHNQEGNNQLVLHSLKTGIIILKT